MIEVQRARVRALCARLMQRPANFDLGSPCRCSIGVASGMAEFVQLGARRQAGLWPLPLLKDEPFLEVAPEFFGLHGSYFAYDANGLSASLGLPEPAVYWYYSISRDPYRIALFYLEAIGDCGPQKPRSSNPASQMNHLAAADIAGFMRHE